MAHHCQNCGDPTVVPGSDCPDCGKGEPHFGWAPGAPPAGAAFPRHPVDATGNARPRVGGPDPWPTTAPTGGGGGGGPAPNPKRGRNIIIGLVIGLLVLAALGFGLYKAFSKAPPPPRPQPAPAPGPNPGPNPNPSPTPGPNPIDAGQGWGPNPPLGWSVVTTSLRGHQLTNGVIEIPYAELGDTVYAEWSNNLPAGSLFCSPAAQTVNRWPTPPANDSLFQAPIGTPGTAQFQMVYVIYPGQCITR